MNNVTKWAEGVDWRFVMQAAMLLLFAATWIPGLPGKQYLFLVLVVTGIAWGIYQNQRGKQAVEAFRHRDITTEQHALLPVREAAGQPLAWWGRDSAWGLPEFHLATNSALVAIYWLDANGQFVEAETSEGHWIGTYEGSSLQVNQAPQGTGRVTLKSGWGWTLEFPDGRAYKVKAGTNMSVSLMSFQQIFRVGEQAVVDEAGTRLVRFDAKKAQCQIEAAAAGLPELPLIVLMGVYVIIHETQFRNDSAD